MTCSKISTGLGSASAAASMNRASSNVAGVTTLSPGICAYQPSRLCECCAASWRAGAGGHADDERHGELPARHMADRCRVVDDLVERKKAEIDRHDFDDRAHPAEGGADPGADEGRFRERRVANAFRAELIEQPLGHRITAAIAPDILAHQK